MAAEAEAAREARAKVIAAEGEQKASRALKEASEIIAESSSALQLRYLQVQFFQDFLYFMLSNFHSYIITFGFYSNFSSLMLVSNLHG